MDATFWALIGLIIFLGIVIYVRVPGQITSALDKRAVRIADELEEARKLREEAQALLAEYQRKQRDAEKEAADIVSAAESNAARMAEEAKQAVEELITRRQKMAETKIAQAEAQAVQDVRSVAAEVAVAAAEKILADKMTGTAANKQITDSISEIKARLQ
ncbi:F0F1 ATP synthase subunit B [Tepidamorphus sp. 3E244]|uniref:F0F1 ATP synthase subunit B n=1 Tax=Tepidamorphus sp. 3E244 TaxID=3385498 RepID=UPI0038FD3555